ncbi:hypothetical protein DCC85_07805 [Paenibacillus sp. CAA11]|uniref:CapA family protein n=1 Tax=Paenibacillus sp. CAA11 TaxID=1532905 RepID=UPI000D37375C|nr:CapA family protein [Paenibacillus sp. CAA11]AWB44133.1 hypothetical protein DCC85_07805 [Paenibacillus sp. CAA11]
MYPPRSDKYKAEKKIRQRKQGRFWTILNLSLIVIICCIGAYYYYDARKHDNPEPATAVLSEQEQSAEGASITGLNSSSEEKTKGQTQSKADPAVSGGAGGQTGDAASKASPASSQATTAPSANENAIVLHFGGDTLFSGKVADKLKASGMDFPFQYVRDLFLKDDLTVLNLETPITVRGTGATDKQFVFKSHPEVLDAMKNAGVDAVNLANNHTLDQGEEGLLDTIDHLKASQIPAVGAGSNADEAYAPVYLERKGIKIALFGFSRVLPKVDWNAGESSPGIAGIYDPTRAIQEVEKAKKQADLVIVVAHWGKERVTKPDKNQTSLAHAFIDAGADLVIGGHPHVLQGVEQYKGKWIAYSTGNFIFTRSSNAKTWETAVFEARCNRSGACGMKLIPYHAELGQPVPMNAQDGAKLLQEIQQLSPGVTVDSGGELKAAGQ